MIEKQLDNGKVASVGQFGVIVYNSKQEFDSAKVEIKKHMERCCKDKGYSSTYNHESKQYVCGFCGNPQR